MNEGAAILAIGDIHLGTACSGLPDEIVALGLDPSEDVALMGVYPPIMREFAADVEPGVCGEVALATYPHIPGFRDTGAGGWRGARGSP